jgi:hypothetical protein
MLRVRATWTGKQGTPYLSTFYFNTASTETQTDANNANAAVGSFLTSLNSSLLLGLNWVTDSNVTVMSLSGTQTGGFGVSPVAGGGTLSGDALPWSTQLLVRYTTGIYIGGRQIKGHLFLPGWSETQNTDGAPVSTLKTTVQNAANTLVGVSSPRWAVWSKKTASISSITGASVSSQWAVLRSRRD